MMTEKCGKASLPALEFAPGGVMLESDDITDKRLADAGVDKRSLEVYKYFHHGSSDDLRYVCACACVCVCVYVTTSPSITSMFKTFRKLFTVGMEHDDGYPDAHTIRDPPLLPSSTRSSTPSTCDTICHPDVVTHRP